MKENKTMSSFFSRRVLSFFVLGYLDMKAWTRERFSYQGRNIMAVELFSAGGGFFFFFFFGYAFA